MTTCFEDDQQELRAASGDNINMSDDLDAADGAASPCPAQAPTRVPMHGPVDMWDMLTAKMLLALCGSVFPHPLLLVQQVLGIEDQDFPDFQLSVAEAGNDCSEIIAAYLTNLRVLQQEEDPTPPVSLSLVQPRHAATVASVATKARDLLTELALARSTVKPRKAPKNRAVESAAKAAAAAATASASASSTSASALPSGASAATTATIATLASSLDSSLSNATAEDLSVLEACALAADDACGSESQDDDSESSGHQDTSRESSCPPLTAREDEERLLYALQGPGAEATLQMARARPVTGWKRNSTSTGEDRPGPDTRPGAKPEASASQPAPANQGNGSNSPHTNSAINSSSGSNTASPRAQQPPPPPARTSSGMQLPALNGPAHSSVTGQPNGQGNGNGIGVSGGSAAHGSTGVRHIPDGGRTGGRGAGAAASLQTVVSCPVNGLRDVTVGAPPSAHNGHSGSNGHHGGQRRNGAGHGHGQGGGRRHGGGAQRPPPATQASVLQQNQAQSQQQQQQHSQAQQQQQIVQLLGLRSASSYGNNSYGNLMSLQGAAIAAAGNGLSGYAQTGSRLDYSAAAAALKLAQQAAALNAAAGSNMHHLAVQYAGGYGGGAAGGYGQLAAGLGSLGGISNTGLVHQHHQQQQQAVSSLAQNALYLAAAAADGQKHAGGAMGGGGSADPWSTVAALYNAQLAAGSMA